MAQTGGDEEKCSPFARAYRSLCPTEWIERWNEAREEGRWTGRYLGCSLRTC
jgi:cytochrome c oxidase subunit 6b